MDDGGYVLLLWTPAGYLLREEEGEPPAPGTELADHGRTLVVSKVGASPLPGDRRPGVFTIGRD